MTDSRGRMGTRAEVLFGANAMTSIVEAAERSQAHGGLRGGWDSDANGRFARVEGAGVPEVGMYRPSVSGWRFLPYLLFASGVRLYRLWLMYWAFEVKNCSS